MVRAPPSADSAPAQHSPDEAARIDRAQQVRFERKRVAFGEGGQQPGGQCCPQQAARAEGERAEQPLSLQKIFFHIDITSNDMTSDDMDWVLRQAEAISPVWIAIQRNVAVETSYKIMPDEK